MSQWVWDFAHAEPTATVFDPFRALGWGGASPTRLSPMPERPSGRIGLYDPTYEHDACGVAMVAKLDGKPSHETVERAIVALENLEHRGAAGADPNTGDGAGILLQLPDELSRPAVVTRPGVERHRLGALHVGLEAAEPEEARRRPSFRCRMHPHGDAPALFSGSNIQKFQAKIVHLEVFP